MKADESTVIERVERVEHVDVMIVGAGISGIGAAVHLQRDCPTKTFTLLETKTAFGGTWRQHTYPGARSDSDLYTFGYGFKPWTGPPIATAGQILDYLDEVLDEHDLRRHIRYEHTITDANWSSDDACWHLRVERADTGRSFTMTCGFLWMCAGYYRHSKGYTPEWDGMCDFEGRIVHPQHWPDDLELTGKRVVVIGSGATAATLIPNIADLCEHVTMLQRSPTYFYPRPNVDELAVQLRSLDVPDEWVHEIMRRKSLSDAQAIHQLSAEVPEFVADELMNAARAYLGDDFDIDTHFRPRYRPWSQRIAVIPDGDLFVGIREGKVSVVTDHIDRFTQRGILLQSGEELEADIVVTATGFELNVLGDMSMAIDGEPLDYAAHVTYRGVMVSDVPNMAVVFGYLRTSWTMRADLISGFVVRLLNHMDELGAQVCTPTLSTEEQSMELRPFVPEEEFNPGYMIRGRELMVRQGTQAPWTASNDYYRERDEFPAIDLDEPALRYR
jgi:cation diffusion facilitator CzcD-associated flavoprotein CzcO